MRLIINEVLIPVQKETIYQTKQINTLFRLDNRQSNLTNNIKLPKTPEVLRAFDMLGVVGSTSRKPYELNETYLFSDSGECFIYKGRSIVNVTNEFIEVTIYDGNLDIYIDFENLKLSDVPLPALNHVKNVTNVKNSLLSNTLKYRYMIADFGGRTKTFAGLINIDYLAPFASVKYIWDQFFAFLGYTYDGSIFNSAEFTDLWISYPKGTAQAGVNEVTLEATTNEGTLSNFFANYKNITTSTTTTKAGGATQNAGFVVNDAGTYEIRVTGEVVKSPFVPFVGSFSMVKNTNSIAQNSIPIKEIVKIEINDDAPFNFDYTFKIDLKAGDIIHFAFLATKSVAVLTTSSLTMTKLNSAAVDFDEAFKDFNLKDFFNEILFKFGLTPVKHKYKKHYTFLQLDEMTDINKAENWSKKFINVESESYIYENYAQNNFFKYNYHNEGDEYFNANLPIQNDNISASVDVIKSKTFAPEQMELGSLIWKLYDREIKDDGSIDFKNLTGRFFFATSERRNLVGVGGSLNFLSSIYENNKVSINQIYTPVFKFQDWNYITSKYYGSVYRILKDSKILKVNLKLSSSDIVDLNLASVKYFEQLSNYYLITKIDKYSPESASVSVEMVRVLPFNPATDKPAPVLQFDNGLTINECLPTGSKIKIKLDNIKDGDLVEFAPQAGQIATQISPSEFEIVLNAGTDIKFKVNDVYLNDLKINLT